VGGWEERLAWCAEWKEEGERKAKANADPLRG
jgi:hypothetical protein